MKKRWIILLLLALIAIIPVFPFSKASAETEVTISFDYQRQSTIASNQIALWVEDEEGHAVRTLLATSFTAGRRGYRNREMSLENWVAAARPDRMDDAALDAVSSATPSTGHLEHTWDLTDDQGNPVPAGNYLIRLEGTLYCVQYPFPVLLLMSFRYESVQYTKRSFPSTAFLPGGSDNLPQEQDSLDHLSDPRCIQDDLWREWRC